MAEKTSLPFAEQQGAQLLLSLFSPYGAAGAEALKPQLWNQLFGMIGSKAMGPGGTPPPDIAAFRRYAQDYNPWAMASLFGGMRPGGASPQEQDILGGSLFGLTAPYDFSNMMRIFQQGQQWSPYPGQGAASMVNPPGAPAGPGQHLSALWEPTPSGQALGPDWQQVMQSQSAGGASAMPLLQGGGGGVPPGMGLGGEQGGPVASQGGWQQLMQMLQGGPQAPAESPPGGGSPYPPSNRPPLPGQTLPGGLQPPPQVGPSSWSAMADQIKALMGGSQPFPTAPGAPQIPTAPQLPGFQIPEFNAPSIMGLQQGGYQDLLRSQPGLMEALQASLNPQINLPGQSIFDLVNAAPQNALMQGYVDKATEGMKAEYINRLREEQLALESRFAGEGSYLSSPMMAGRGELTADLTAQYLRDIGGMQLQAAEGERGRIYGAAGQQYGTEFQRNAQQVQLRAEQSRAMSQLFGQMASQAASKTGDMASQAYAEKLRAMASQYASEADYLASTYGTQMGGLTNIFGTQAGIYGNQLGSYNTGQGQMLNAVQQAMQLMQSGQAQSFQQALQMAQMQQTQNQSALDQLREQWDRPGFNMLQLLMPLLRLPTVQKTTGGGFDFNALLGGIGGVLNK